MCKKDCKNGNKFHFWDRATSFKSVQQKNKIKNNVDFDSQIFRQFLKLTSKTLLLVTLLIYIYKSLVDFKEQECELWN